MDQQALECCRLFGLYMADMGWLTLTLEDHFNGVLGEAAVMLAELEECKPIARDVSFVQVRMLLHLAQY